jgi:type IV secretory pathway VirB10-like protein
MLRSGSPELVRLELAAWAAATEMTRGVARAAAAAAAPARKGRRADLPVQVREISQARARLAVKAAIRSGQAGYTALTTELGKYRTVIDRNRHRARKAKCASTFPHASRADTVTRTAPAVITLANTPPDQREHRKPSGPPSGPAVPAVTGTARRPSAHPESETTHRNQNGELRTDTEMPKPRGIGSYPHLAVVIHRLAHSMSTSNRM